MAVIYCLRRGWYHKQGRFAPEDVEAVIKMRHTFGQRDNETEVEWLERLKLQDDEYAAETDRLESESSDKD